MPVTAVRAFLRFVVSVGVVVAYDSTADLMTEVYAQLRAGITKEEAFRRAQLKAIVRSETAALFHWAAFTLSGDWR